jgi:hypothetical protein
MSIPIEQAGQQTHADRPTQSLLQSSLDIVWSYSRSQTFLGSQLPSSPSFVEHYRRDEEEGSASDEEDDGEDEDYNASSKSFEDEDQAQLDLIGGPGEVVEGPPDRSSQLGLFDGHHLPRNASANFKKRRRSHRAPSDGLTTGSHVDEPSPAYSEASPLLAPPGTRGPYGGGSSPPDGVPFPRRSPSLMAQLRRSGTNLKVSHAAAEEVFIEEDTVVFGSSTFGQSLFNSINVLVGVGILAERASHPPPRRHGLFKSITHRFGRFSARICLRGMGRWYTLAIILRCCDKLHVCLFMLYTITRRHGRLIYLKGQVARKNTRRRPYATHVRRHWFKSVRPRCKNVCQLDLLRRTVGSEVGFARRGDYLPQVAHGRRTALLL